LAEEEFTEAAEYFERESPGLGVTFIDAVEACVAEIVEFPEAGVFPISCRIRSNPTTSGCSP